MDDNSFGSGDIAQILANHHYTDCQQIKNQYNCDMMNWINSHQSGDKACETCCENAGTDRRQCIRKYSNSADCESDTVDLAAGEGVPVIKLVEDRCQQLGPAYGNQMWNKMGCDATCTMCHRNPDVDYNGDDDGSHNYNECYEKAADIWVKKLDCNGDNDATFPCQDKLCSQTCNMVKSGLNPLLGNCSGDIGIYMCSVTCEHCDEDTAAGDRRRRV